MPDLKDATAMFRRTIEHILRDPIDAEIVKLADAIDTALRQMMRERYTPPSSVEARARKRRLQTFLQEVLRRLG